MAYPIRSLSFNSTPQFDATQNTNDHNLKTNRIALQKFSIFFSLPPEVACLILNRITSLKDLVNLITVVKSTKFKGTAYQSALLTNLYIKILNVPNPISSGLNPNRQTQQKAQTLNFIQYLQNNVRFNSLKFHFSNANEKDFENIKKWTPQITTLEIAHAPYNSKWFDHFPPNLTSLSLPHMLAISDNVFSKLPSELTELNLGCLSIRSSIMPPQLTKLVLAVMNITTNMIKSLPSTLKELYLENAEIEDGYFQFPPQLTTLFLPKCSKITNTAIQTLPKTLTDLNLSSNDNFYFLSYLPQSIKKLVLGGGKINDIALGFLPEGLEKLSLLNANVRDSGIAILNKKLTQLYLPSAFTDGSSFKNLSRNLVELQLGTNVNRRTIDANHLENLPQTLRTLDLRNFKFTPKDMSLLPETIEVLWIHSFDFSQKNENNYPTQLLELSLVDDQNISNVDIQYLPRRLSRLFLTGETLTEACLDHLPPDLEVFSCSKNPKLEIQWKTRNGIAIDEPETLPID